MPKTSTRPVVVSYTIDIDPAEMGRRGKIGAHRLHATHDSRAITANARQAFLATFEKEVDPDGTLPPEERARRAGHARRAHFARLARLSALARRKPEPSALPQEADRAST